MKALKLLSSIAIALFLSTVLIGCSDSDSDGGEPNVPVDKTALQAKIQEATQLLSNSTQGTQPGQYPPAAMTAFTNAIAAAKEVNTNTAAKQDDVDQAVITLDTAITTFKAAQVPTPQINKTALQAALTNANTTYAEAVVGYLKGQYRKADKDTFKTAIDAAQAVYDSATATQAEIDAAVTTLNTAVTTFTGKANQKDYDQYLSVYLKMDGNTNDESYYANTIASVACDGPVPTLATDRFGVVNKAYSFAGGCLTVPNSQIVRPEALTMSFWVKTASDASSDRAVISLHWWDGIIVKQIGKQLFFQANNGGGAYIGTYNEFAAGSWYHVAVTCTNSRYEIYVNGALDNSADFTPTALIIPETEPLCLGVLCSTHDYYSFQGDLDEFRFYSKALTAAEIEAIYNAEKP